ncbi:pheromone receptor [Moniliophthora roreri MCA 2997]|uniref:Pheromone receptor n=1 Tax=Moniliophthora roreri (strain MCA 2997) TaxID=1381753 RepID=V2X053_MONRO|nr:pheromone receptor [Moniliophthora roreri MCA 2997]
MVCRLISRPSLEAGCSSRSNCVAWNAGACLYILWTSLACLNQFVNSVVWTGNVVNRAPVWCVICRCFSTSLNGIMLIAFQIAAKFIIGTTSALPACSLCINRRIYRMLSTNTFPITRKERIRVLTEELAIGLGIPIVHMILHYVPQDHAFDILEDIGCYPLPYHNTWVTFVLYSTWPLALGTISAVYGIMNLVIINKPSSRTRFFLSKDNKSMDWSRYWRLTLLACLKILASVGICVYLMYSSINEIEMWPWISWSNTHAEFSRIRQIPTSVWRSWPTAKCFELSRWSPALCAFIYLAIFGTCSEARKTYRSVYGSVLLFKRRYHTRGEATDAAQSVVEDPRPESHLHPPRHSTVSSAVLDITSEHVAANIYAQP